MSQPHWNENNNPMSLKPLQVATPSTQEGPYSGGTENTLPEVRKKASFNVKELTHFLDGGVKATKRRMFITSPNKGVDVSDKYYWTRPEILEKHISHFIEVHKEFAGKITPSRQDVAWMSQNALLGGSLSNHYGLFLNTIYTQANPDQMMWWLFRAALLQIVGTYAQTELGHGSNVRGLQTTAHFDKASQEFIINTPTLRSIKWWPGALGKAATHALVYAQLILDGKEYGVHIFMVQIRDENHRPLPGIEVGDLGPKIGDRANDTGFLRLDNIRIPREHMLARYQEVSPEGKYVKSESKPNEKIHYATMMFTRGFMVAWAGSFLSRAVTIATRYSFVRTQGFMDTKTTFSYNSPERPIIDYHIQRYRLLKQISLTYAIIFAGKWMIDRFNTLDNEKNPGAIEAVTDLPEIAATAAGLKGLSTFLTCEGIEDCRKCCGGNGYLLNSGIAALAADYMWQVTAEGDWVILLLQTARFLIKSFKKVVGGERLSGPLSYLNKVTESGGGLGHTPAASCKEDYKSNLNFFSDLFKYRALLHVTNVSNLLQERINSGMKYDDAWTITGRNLLEMSKIHCMSFMLETFKDIVSTVEDPSIRSVLTRLCALFACSNVLEGQWAGVLDGKQLELCNQAVDELLDELKYDALPLVDAFDIPDNVICSTIGRYDGNVYEALYEAAKKSTLNMRDPFPGYETALKPHLDRDFLKLRNKLYSNL